MAAIVSKAVVVLLVLALAFLIRNAVRSLLGKSEKLPAKKDEKKPVHHDSAREAIETIVFVVVLVLLLKLFITEAFVIPTGSMAETLYGYQKMVKCPKCGHEFPVNSHDEVEGQAQNGVKKFLSGFTCPNCRYLGNVGECKPVPDSRSGDRVLVLKPQYHFTAPTRGDVVVFKYPEKPQDKHTAQNYIKRCMGFGYETIAIYRGDLFVTRSLEYPADEQDGFGSYLYPRPEDSLDLWKPPYMYANNAKAEELFKLSLAAGFPAGNGGFEIVRKGEKQLLADMRIVYDDDQQPAELAGKVPSRWYAPAGSESEWTADRTDQPRIFAHKGEGPDQHWIRYRHLATPWSLGQPNPLDPLPPNAAGDITMLEAQKPEKIDNFLGYNAGRDQDPITGVVTPSRDSGADKLWVGDLILECNATFDPGSEVVLELSKGINRFQAKFAGGKVTLSRIGSGAVEFGNPSATCKISPGTHELRFANVDCRLWVWVDGNLIDFGTSANYMPIEAGPADGADAEGWTQANDVDAPASIGATGKVTIQNIKLFRDVYYTRKNNDPTTADIYYVQPGHYLCLGDNSAQSSDSRTWGSVPERLMLGKAVFVFYPTGMPYLDSDWPLLHFYQSRVGFIK